MHTIIRDGNRMHLGISTGGHYLSEDGGETFTAANNGVGAGFTPDPYPEFGQCVHKIARHNDAPGRLYMQNHGGWAELDRTRRTAARHRRAAQRRPRPHAGDRSPRGCRRTSASRSSSIRTTPTPSMSCRSSPTTRTCPGGAPAVWRSENGGDSWRRLATGLPKKESYFTVLRDAMDIDRAQVARALLRHDDRPALDRPRRRREVGMPVRLAAADPLREGRGRLRLRLTRARLM